MRAPGPILQTLLLGVVSCPVLAGQSAPLTTAQNCTLAVPAAGIAAGLPGVTNLAGSNFMLSAVMPGTLQGGRALLANAQQWATGYNAGPGSAQNDGRAVAVRGDGSIVVTGPSQGPGTGQDFVTLAYASDGRPLWTNRYDGPAHGDDYAYYVSAAASGEVWVVGESARSTTNSVLTDVVLLKYASNGTPAWTNRYTSFATNGVTPWALAVDGSGNAFVNLQVTYWPSMSGGKPLETAIVKYDPQGNVAWTRHYPRSGLRPSGDPYEAEAMAVDGAGNLWVGGGSSVAGAAVAVVKYSGDGTPVWTNHVPFPLVDSISLLCLDRAGNLFVTGEQWNNNERDCLVIKCSPGGAALWTNVLAGPAYDGGNMPQTVPDPAGNLFVLAGMTDAASPGLYQILKVSPGGLPLWTNQTAVFGPANGMLCGSAVDSAGNLVLTGYAPAPGTGDPEVVTAKYSGDCHLLWTNRFNGPAGLRAYPCGLALDDAGNAYVTGQWERSLGNWDLALVKYADQLRYTPPAGFTGADALTCTVTDPLGNSATGSVVVQVLPVSFQFNLSPAVTRLTPWGLVAQLDGAPGTNAVVIEASTDLVHWQPLLTNAPWNGSVPFFDPGALGQSHRFYRARQVNSPD